MIDFHLYPSGLLRRHWGNHIIPPVPGKQPWRIWVNTCHALLEVTYLHEVYLNCCWISHTHKIIFQNFMTSAFTSTEEDFFHSCCVNNLSFEGVISMHCWSGTCRMQYYLMMLYIFLFSWHLFPNRVIFWLRFSTIAEVLLSQSAALSLSLEVIWIILKILRWFFGL